MTKKTRLQRTVKLAFLGLEIIKSRQHCSTQMLSYLDASELDLVRCMDPRDSIDRNLAEALVNEFGSGQLQLVHG